MKNVLYTRTNWIKQGEESLQQIVWGIYDPNAILKNLSEQDFIFYSKDLIYHERNAVNLYDHLDRQGQK